MNEGMAPRGAQVRRDLDTRPEVVNLQDEQYIRKTAERMQDVVRPGAGRRCPLASLPHASSDAHSCPLLHTHTLSLTHMHTFRAPSLSTC